jgi:hypothetical protein
MSTNAADSNAASVRSTISRRKLAANRRNARKSTGPRTPDGKRIASINARGHGLFSRNLILPGENREEFIHLWNSIQNTLQAKNLLELSLVSRFVQAQWKLLRVQSADAALHEMAEQELLEKAQKQLLKLMDKKENYRCRIDDHLETFIRTQLQRTQKKIEEAVDGDLPAGRMLAESLRRVGGAASGSRERLSQYEHRIEGSGMRALSMLLKLRKQMAEQPNDPAEPVRYLINGGAIADDKSLETALQEMQNEPTAEESPANVEAAEGCNSVDRGLSVPPERESSEQSSGGTPQPQELPPTGAQTGGRTDADALAEGSG